MARTHARGEYTLTPHAQAVFIFVTRPAQSDVEGDWYKPLAAVVDSGYHLGQKQLLVNGRNLEYPTNEVQPMHAE